MDARYASANQIAYGWACNPQGLPVPIAEAVRGVAYQCPRCATPMIARLGQQKQHHFSHEALTDCTAENVAASVIMRLCRHLLEGYQNQHEAFTFTWQCKHCGKQHTADLLANIASFEEGNIADNAFLALRRPNGKTGVFLVIGPAPAPPHFGTPIDYHLPDSLAAYVAEPDLTMLYLKTSVLGDAGAEGSTIINWVRGASVIDADCPLLATLNVVRDPAKVKQALFETIRGAPRGLVLPMDESSPELIRLPEANGSKLLWLPREGWRKTIGGSLSVLGGVLEIIAQTVPQNDGSVMFLYYITLRGTHAVAGRCYPAYMQPVPHIDERYRIRKTIAADVGRTLIEG
jgi:predicted RNA-binding Zn-ribbon protein involved in translation (DUF1610 family)